MLFNPRNPIMHLTLTTDGDLPGPSDNKVFNDLITCKRSIFQIRFVMTIERGH